MTAKEAAALLLYIKMTEIELESDEIREFSTHFQRGHFTEQKVDETVRHFDVLWERALKPVWKYIEGRRLDQTADKWTTGDNRPTLTPVEEKEVVQSNIDWSNL